MKTLSLVSLVVLFAAFFSVGIFSGDAQAAFAEYLGDICWSFDMNDGTTGRLDVGLQTMGGGGHYLMSGVFTTFGGGAVDSIINGNAEVFANGVFMTLTRSRLDGSGMTSSIIHVTLDPVTLNGTIDESLTASDNAVSSTVPPLFGFRQGNIFIGCP